MNSRPIIVALDYPTADAALAMAAMLDPKRCRVKIGNTLFTSAGPALVERLQGRGFEVFLDLKFHDIPNTVAGACAAAADLGVWMLNVHAAGGLAMLRAAREALPAGPHAPLLIAVTVLTSLDAADLGQVGIPGTVDAQVLRLARLTQEAGCDGVVCSPQEIGSLRDALPGGFRLVTPGIRPASAARGDQKRVMSPRAALAAGASDLVIGRAITAAPSPMAALEEIERELSAPS